MLAEANEYFDKRLWTDEWDNSNDTVKEKALNHAETLLKNLDILESFEDDNQNIAIFEQALYMLNLDEEDRTRLNLQAQNVSSIDISGGVSEDYDLNSEGSNIKSPYLAPRVKDLMEADGVKLGGEEEYRVGDMI